MKRRSLFAALAAASATPWLGGCAGFPVGRVVDKLDEPPPATPREFRAVWVCTVANIDWPSRKGLSAAEQQAEMIVLLDRAQATGLNAILLQVRPSADAIYPSTLEPWTEYLTGTQGQDPGWDPLARWIAEAHKRGLELHAWFNPYRAKAAPGTSDFAPLHLARRRPDLVRRYGDMHWIDPAEPEAAAHTLAVFEDVIRRYDIDGIHIDDYFYPYPVQRDGKDVDFPDDAPWQRYLAGGGKLARADWRRSHVDALVEQLWQLAQRCGKPWLRLGVSPFGIPRPDRRPAGIAGLSQYDALYADVERWLEAGWMDYLMPQLYWPIEQKAQAFGVLFDAWHRGNPHGRHIWPGLFSSRLPRETGGGGAPAEGRPPWPASELLNQIELMHRQAPPGATLGHAHFSMVALAQDRAGINALLRDGPYARPALAPVSPWVGGQAPAAPSVRASRRFADGGLDLHVDTAQAGAAPARYAVWRRERAAGGNRHWRLSVEAAAPTLRLPDSATVDAVVLRAIDRCGLESPPTILDLGPRS